MAYTDIDKPEDYFNTVLYTGNGGTQSITGVGFQPDWVWVKCRSNADGHVTSDSVRGANKQLFTNTTDQEFSATTQITSFNSDGFSLGTDSGVNGSGRTFASWNWLAGGSASSNSNGSITSNVSASTTSGFSIVSYTGTGSTATIGHGLGSAPKMIIAKVRSGADNWMVGHDGIGWTHRMQLNLTNAAGALTAAWNNTAPTSSVFTVGTNGTVNGNGSTYVAYCFAEKKGYSKFGSYTGNGSATDGTFVYTGFKPAFFMTKRSDVANSWVMFDNTRSTFNEINNSFYANTNEAEETGTSNNDLDFLSNGIKIREDNNALNASGGTYIYMAFAENPFVTSTGVPATAR